MASFSPLTSELRRRDSLISFSTLPKAPVVSGGMIREVPACASSILDQSATRSLAAAFGDLHTETDFLTLRGMAPNPWTRDAVSNTTDYSYLKATMGSTRVARRAGV